MADDGEFPGWLEPRAALDAVIAANGSTEAAAEKALRAAISNNLIQVGARSVVLDPMPPQGISATTPIYVPAGYWKRVLPSASDFLSGYMAFAHEVATGRQSRRTIVVSKVTYFGLKLNPDDVSRHFPPSKRTVAPASSAADVPEVDKEFLQKLTEEEYGRWVPVVAAIQRLNERLKLPGESVRALMPYLRTGRIRAGASSCQADSNPPTGVVEIESDRWPSDMKDSAGLWRTGTLQIAYPGNQRPYTHLVYLGVRLENHRLGELIGAVAPVLPEVTYASAAPSAPNPPQAAPVPHAGGAPRKQFWDDLFIAMFDGIWQGTLKPRRAADLERAMLDWASANGHQLSESSVKTPARKLFAAYNKEVKN